MGLPKMKKSETSNWNLSLVPWPPSSVEEEEECWRLVGTEGGSRDLWSGSPGLVSNLGSIIVINIISINVINIIMSL